jgi:hypothetical protein
VLRALDRFAGLAAMVGFVALMALVSAIVPGLSR